jgi:hypothetical protein
MRPDISRASHSAGLALCQTNHVLRTTPCSPSQPVHLQMGPNTPTQICLLPVRKESMTELAGFTSQKRGPSSRHRPRFWRSLCLALMPIWQDRTSRSTASFPPSDNNHNTSPKRSQLGKHTPSAKPAKRLSPRVHLIGLYATQCEPRSLVWRIAENLETKAELALR